MSVIIIAGLTGLVGSEVVKYFCKKKYTYINYYIRKKIKIKKIFQKYNKNIKLIIYTAVQQFDDWAIKEPFTDYYWSNKYN